MTTSVATLSILDNSIRVIDNLYSLNDLHKAAGDEPKHKPANFLRNQQTIDLIELLKSEQLKPTVSKQGLGTFVVKELVYAYAMWISAKFHLLVIRAFDAMYSSSQQQHPTQDCLISQTLHHLSAGNKKLYMSMYGGMLNYLGVRRISEIPANKTNEAVAKLYALAIEWHRKNNPTQLPLKLNDGEHYLVVKDGVVLWEKVLKDNCNNLPENVISNPKLMIEHIRQVVGEFIGKDALPAPKPQLTINYPAITARPPHSRHPNQHWYKAQDFVDGQFDPIKDFLSQLEQAGYEVTGLKIINDAKTWVIQQQDEAFKLIERGYKSLKAIDEGIYLYNKYGMSVYGFQSGKVSY